MSAQYDNDINQIEWRLINFFMLPLSYLPTCYSDKFENAAEMRQYELP